MRQISPRALGRALDLFTAFVVVSIMAALAGLTWRLAGHADVGAIVVAPPRAPAPVADTAPILALAPFGRPGADGEGAPATALQIVLKGVVAARPDSLSIAYIASGTEAPRAYKVGDVVAGATVQAIQPRRILLLNAGRSEFLAFPDPAAAPAGGMTAAPPAPPPQPAAPPPSPALIGDAVPTPGGYRIGANAPPGLRAGDVVAQVNGQAVTGEAAAQAALARAAAGGSAQVQIVRDGRPITLTVPIR